MINKYFIENVYSKHLSVINQSENNCDIINCIIGDMLMGKVQKYNNTIFLSINANVLNLIKRWYILLNSVFSFNSLFYKIDHFFVYRGINLNEFLSVNENIVHPIPFSTCLDYNNSLLWINESRAHSYILKIKITKKTPFIFTGNKDEGNEVILPAGSLKITNITGFIVECDLVHYTYKEMVQNFKNIKVVFY